MKLAWHIFLKDLRRLRLPLACWIGLFVLQYVGFALLPVRSWDDRTVPLHFAVHGVLWGLELVVAWLLVGQLLHDDPLVGEWAAWRTRPISPRRLLAAKAFGGFLLLCVLPTLLLAPWWMRFDFGPTEILITAIANIVGFALFLSLATLVAVLTADLLRFIGWSLLLAIGASLLLLIVANTSAVVGDEGLPVALLLTRLWLGGGVALVGVAAVVALQFFTRRYALALSLTGAVVILVGAVTWAWPWTLDQMSAAAGAERYARPHPSAKLRAATLFVPPPTNAAGKASLQLAVDFSAADIAAGDDLSWASLQATLRHGEQGRLPLTQRWEPVFAGERDITGRMEALADGRGDQRAAWSGWFTTKIDLPATVAPRLRDGQASLVGEASGQLWRGWREGLMPLRDGAGLHHGLTATRLLRIVGAPTPVAEFGNFIEWAKASPLIAPDNLLARFRSSTQPLNAYTHMLVKGRGVLVDLRPQWFWREGRYHELIEVPVGLVLFEGLVADFFPNNRDGQRQSAPAAPARFIDATVARVRFEEAARLAIPLNVPTLTPDLVVEGDLEVALRRAQAEHKRVLVLVRHREFDPVAQTAPASWYSPEIRELLRSGFVCAQVFTTTDARFRMPNLTAPIYTNVVVLTADGARQDALSVPDVAQFWTLALRSATQGGTYVDALRREFDKPDSKMSNGMLALALFARGDVAAGVELLLRASPRSDEERRWRELWNMPAMTWDLAQWVVSFPETREVLRQQFEMTRAELQRNPRDTAAAGRLFAITFALKEPGPWADFPRALPKENPDHWRLLMAWVARSNNRDKIPLVPDAVEWDTFFREGRRWVQSLLADARRDPQVDYPALARHWRGNLLILGVKGVGVLAKAGEVERARALAAEVQQVTRFGDRTTRQALADALAGRTSSGAYDPWADQR